MIQTELNGDDLDSAAGNEKKPLSATSKSLASLNQQNLGYTPIPQVYMERNVRSQVQWINHFSASSQIRSFPSDLIEQNGKQVYDFIFLLLVSAP